MLAVLEKSIDFIIFIILGYSFKKIGWLRKEDFFILSKIILSVTLPCAIIYNFSNMSLDISLILICAIGIVMNLIMIYIGFMMFRRDSKEKQAFAMINMSGFNIGGFTLPFVQNFFTAMGIAAVSLYDTGNAIMCTGITYTMANAVKGEKSRISLGRSVRDLFSSVSFDAYIVMTLITVLHITLPKVIVNWASIGAGANSFLSMFSIGVGMELSLKKEQIHELIKWLSVRFGTAIACAIIFYLFIPIDNKIKQGIIIAMLAPISGVAPAFTGKIGGDIELSSTLNSFSILISLCLIIISILVLNV